MKTFTALKDFVDNAHFDKHRQKSLSQLDFETIDPPIIEIIRGFSNLPYCFTLQSCYGHFVHEFQQDSKNIEPLPAASIISKIEYRIAYLALCIQNNEKGKKLFQDLQRIPNIDPEYIQFGSAEWFWKQHVNSYALQVEPKRLMTRDRIFVDYDKALRIEKVRNEFFNAMKKII